MSAGDACGTAAFSAGCGSRAPITVSQRRSWCRPIPTRPLLLAPASTTTRWCRSIGTLVNRSLVFRVAWLAEHHELSLRLEPSANILHHEDESSAANSGSDDAKTRWIQVTCSVRRSESIRMDIFRPVEAGKRFAYKDARRRASESISSLRVSVERPATRGQPDR